MCVILYLEPEEMPSQTQLKWAITNNKHGIGLIMQDENYQIVSNSKTLLDGNAQPDSLATSLYNLLLENRHLHRSVHLRYATKGLVSEDNLHPFTIVENTLYLMHNGTIPTLGCVNKSDTQVFAETMAKDLEGITAEDLKKPFVQNFLKKCFPDIASRFLLIGNGIPPLFIGKWEVVKGEKDETVFLSSNNSYFSADMRTVTYSGYGGQTYHEKNRLYNDPYLNENYEGKVTKLFYNGEWQPISKKNSPERNENSCEKSRSMSTTKIYTDGLKDLVSRLCKDTTRLPSLEDPEWAELLVDFNTHPNVFSFFIRNYQTQAFLLLEELIYYHVLNGEFYDEDNDPFQDCYETVQ